MNYNHVSLFVRVVKAGGFTAAAAALKLPKSSVSRSVALLEKDLGVRLLQRTTRKIALTDAGQAYFDSVSASVAEIDEADALARERGDEPRGTVRLSVPPDVGPLPGALARFSRSHPGIRLEVSIASRYVDLVAEGFDLAVRAGQLEDSSLIVRRIGTAEMALMASPSYLRRRGRPKKVSELAEHEWVLYRATAGRTVVKLTGPEGPASVEVSASMIADDLSFCRKAVEAGAGIALLPIHTVSEAVAGASLEQVLPEWSYGGASLFVVLPTTRYLPTRVALVRDFLVEHLTEQLAETKARCAKGRAKGRRG